MVDRRRGFGQNDRGGGFGRNRNEGGDRPRWRDREGGQGGGGGGGRGFQGSRPYGGGGGGGGSRSFGDRPFGGGGGGDRSFGDRPSFQDRPERPAYQERRPPAPPEEVEDFEEVDAELAIAILETAARLTEIVGTAGLPEGHVERRQEVLETFQMLYFSVLDSVTGGDEEEEEDAEESSDEE